MDLTLEHSLTRRRGLDAGELAFAFFVALSFLAKIITLVLRSYFLLSLGLLLCAAIPVFFLPWKRERRVTSAALWSLAFLFVLWAHRDPRPFLSDYLSIFVFLAGLILLFYSGDRADRFDATSRTALYFSLFYALSVWVQILLPPLYRIFLNRLPEAYRASISSMGQQNMSFTGFSSNAGFTAGHILIGILLLLAGLGARGRRGRGASFLLLAFLALSLLMTGRRAHILFLLLALAAMYLLPHRGRTFYSRLGKAVFLSLTALLLVIWLMGFLVSLPFFSRISLSISGFLSGDDVTSGRSGLFRLAWQTFLEHPLFGIGWGNFRHTTIGMVTLRTELDVHNIYLQLLCETGITGFMALVTPMAVFFVKTLKKIRSLALPGPDQVWLSPLRFSLGYQAFFLLYGMTGNPLYEPVFFIPYFFALALTAAFGRSRLAAFEKLSSEKAGLS